MIAELVEYCPLCAP